MTRATLNGLVIYNGDLMRLLLKIEYEGTRFHGWQIQPNVRTVQGVLEDAVGRMMEEPVRIIGSGRTDAGVHALGQVAHCDVPRDIPADNIRMGLNSILPEDVKVQECRPAPEGFHAQFSAIGKRYTYQILNRQNPTAVYRHRVWHLKHPLDLEAMTLGAGFLTGKKDFASFKSTGDDKTTVRDLRELSIAREGDLVKLSFEANGFLKYMVRNMVGALTWVGVGRMSPEDLKALLETRTRKDAPKKAPPQGLTLECVFYE